MLLDVGGTGKGNIYSHVPHPTAPNIIPPNMDDDSRPINLSCTGENQMKLGADCIKQEKRRVREEGEGLGRHEEREHYYMLDVEGRVSIQSLDIEWATYLRSAVALEGG